MSDLRIIPRINGQIINDPNNLPELSISISVDEDNPTVRTSINDWELGVGTRTGADGARFANEHISNGLTGGVGVYEGMPFTLDLEKNGNIDRVFDGYLDLSGALVECEKVTAPAKETQRIEWLQDVADSFTFEFLVDNDTSDGRITTDDYVLIPYIISRLPQTADAIILTVSIFVIVQQIRSQITELRKQIQSLANFFEWTAVLKLATTIIFLGTLIVATIQLVRDLFNLIIQPVKYVAGMRYIDLCRKGALHLGYTFESTILESDNESNLIWIPEKFERPQDNDGVLGFLTPDNRVQEGFYRGTYGEWLRYLKSRYNAKLIVDGTTIRLERRDFSNAANLYQVPNREDDGFSFNTNEFRSNYIIEYQVDFNDKNTALNYRGNVIQIETSPVVVVNRGMVLTKGFERITLPTARGIRKIDLTVPERILRGLFTVLDPLIQSVTFIVNTSIGLVNILIDVVNTIFRLLRTVTFGAIRIPNIPRISPLRYNSIADLIENRIDMLVMENDFISVPKTVSVIEMGNARNNKLLPNNELVTSAEYLWDNYHFVNSFDGQEHDIHNQHLIYKLSNIPFCYDDYIRIRDDNRVIDRDGIRTGELINLEWNISNETADIEYKINSIFTNNLQTRKIIPNGR